MSYRIAAASSDGIRIDTAYGQAEQFRIYEVDDAGITLAEIRPAEAKSTPHPHEGCSGNGGGCSEHTGTEPVSDCKCVLCKSFGRKVIKYLERNGIYAFDIECDIETALKKITAYLERVEFHRRV